ncbi:hypothetical protein NKH18_34545 [Streptomyces sp. M10(2022)]
MTSLLAARHDVRVQLREQKGSGVTAVVVLPQALLPKAPPASSPPPVVAGRRPHSTCRGRSPRPIPMHCRAVRPWSGPARTR